MKENMKRLLTKIFKALVSENQNLKGSEYHFTQKKIYRAEKLVDYLHYKRIFSLFFQLPSQNRNLNDLKFLHFKLF